MCEPFEHVLEKSADQEACWHCPSSKLKPPRTAVWIAVDNNPLMGRAEVNGDPEDLRDMPREVQEIAFETGMIPYLPDHRE
jgi:hypothetical protein